MLTTLFLFHANNRSILDVVSNNFKTTYSIYLIVPKYEHNIHIIMSFKDLSRFASLLQEFSSHCK